MGQPIDVIGTAVVGDVLLVDTDRSITGQDGSGFTSAEEAQGVDTLPADLATRLFASEDAIAHVFVASNQVVIERSGGWSEADVAAATQIVAEFFVFYGD